VTIWCPVMLNDELDLLEARLRELEPWGARHVLVEAGTTHRGVPKPLAYAESIECFGKWSLSILHVVASLPAEASPWEREHAQRDAAWPVINAYAADGDVVLIADVDEFPSAAALAWRGPGAVSLFMKTCLFAVDWLVPDECIPPSAVMATAGWLRRQGGSLASVRDNRGAYRVIRDGGWHFSWLGGIERQQQKLMTATCHTELLNTQEGGLILTGERYRSGQHAEGHLPVIPAEVDETWPAFIRERQCPPEWFRPRDCVPA
jgi:Glycosyltransferase family 17